MPASVFAESAWRLRLQRLRSLPASQHLHQPAAPLLDLRKVGRPSSSASSTRPRSWRGLEARDDFVIFGGRHHIFGPGRKNFADRLLRRDNAVRR